MRYFTLSATLVMCLTFVEPAWAQNGPSLCGSDNGDGTVALAPCPNSPPTDLGTDAEPWNVVKAEAIQVQGRVGVTQTIHLQNCTLIVVGGIIVKTKSTVPPFSSPCP